MRLSTRRSGLEQGLKSALDHLNAGDITAAAVTCAELLRTAPDHPAVRQMHAAIALRDGKPGLALDSARRSLAGRPGHVPSLLLCAQAARAAGLGKQALGPLRQAAMLAPALPEPAFLLCRILLELNDPALDAAIEQAASRHPGQAADWHRLALDLQQGHRPKAALDAFTRAGKADPGLAAAHFGRGLLLREAGRIAEAQAALQQAVERDPTASAAWFALGLTCQDQSNEAAAAVAFAAALRHRPTFAEAAVNLGIARQSLGDMAAALEAYRAAIRIRPDTLGRIAQAVTTARAGLLCLDPAAFRRLLGA